MKVGDLVTLSSYGMSVKRTNWVQKGDVGIVTKVFECWHTPGTEGQSQYAVKGVKSKFFTGMRSWHHTLHFNRKDLKYVKGPQ